MYCELGVGNIKFIFYGFPRVLRCFLGSCAKETNMTIKERVTKEVGLGKMRRWLYIKFNEKSAQ